MLRPGEGLCAGVPDSAAGQVEVFHVGDVLGLGEGDRPGVADLVTHYIEWVLLGVIAFTIVVMVVHYLRMRAEARRDARNPRPVEIVSPED